MTTRTSSSNLPVVRKPNLKGRLSKDDKSTTKRVIRRTLTHIHNGLTKPEEVSTFIAVEARDDATEFVKHLTEPLVESFAEVFFDGLSGFVSEFSSAKPVISALQRGYDGDAIETCIQSAIFVGDIDDFKKSTQYGQIKGVVKYMMTELGKSIEEQSDTMSDAVIKHYFENLAE